MNQYNILILCCNKNLNLVYIHTYIYTCIHMYVGIHIHTYIHTYIHHIYTGVSTNALEWTDCLDLGGSSS